MPGSGANPLSPIGQAGELHALKSGDGKLQSIEELFEGRHFDRDVIIVRGDLQPPTAYTKRRCSISAANTSGSTGFVR